MQPVLLTRDAGDNVYGPRLIVYQASHVNRLEGEWTALFFMIRLIRNSA